MQVLGDTVVLAVVCQIGTVTTVEQFQFGILNEYLHVLLVLLLAFLVDELNSLFKRDGHGVGTLGQ